VYAGQSETNKESNHGTLAIVQRTISAGLSFAEWQLVEDATEADLLRPKEPVRNFFNMLVAKDATPS
jgi:hypothetical protein